MLVKGNKPKKFILWMLQQGLKPTVFILFVLILPLYLIEGWNEYEKTLRLVPFDVCVAQIVNYECEVLFEKDY